MTIKSLLIRFTIIYAALLVLAAIVLILLNAKLNPGAHTGALVGAVLLVCKQFFSKNQRNFTASEKKTAIIGISVINLLLQTLAALVAGIVQLPLGPLLMVSMLIGLLHSALIYFIVGMAGKQYARQA